MGKIWEKYQLHKNVLLPVLGILAVTLFMLPYVLLGEGSYVQIHDQIDGEILNYIYQAKYLFKGDTIPEFMNGMSKAAMTPPAPFGVLFYVVLPPFAAFVTMQWFAVLVGFLGMYFLCKKLGMLEEISFVTAVLFAFMPFYPTYGLAALGQPLLVLCFLELLNGTKKWAPFVGIIIYAGFSSLTLVGYVWVCIGVLVGLWLFLKKRAMKRFVTGWCVLTGAYVLTNLDLFGSVFGKGFTTHREEMVLAATDNLWDKFCELFFVGGSYSNVYSKVIFAGVLVVLVLRLVLFGVKGKKAADGEKAEWQRWIAGLSMLLGMIVVLTMCSVLWNCAAVVAVRKMLGGIFEYFQADRVYWIFPFLWMLLLAVLLQILYMLGKEKKLPVRMGLLGLAVLMLGAEGYQILQDSNFNKNIRLVLLEDYEQVTWESIYMEEVFREIDKVIGDEKYDCSVVSLGMYPSVALYNGYTCADGYSNNYDLEYKHEFRKIQEAELDKNPELKKYFDEWGNRLYLVSASAGMNGMIGKNQGIAFENLNYDMSAMKELNIRYVFSAAQITDAEKMGWSLAEESPFVSESSYYAVWVYRVGE